MLLLAPLAILKVILLLIVLLVFATICTFASLAAKKGVPYARWRHRLVASSSGLGKLVLICLGFWTRVDGWENYRCAVAHGTV
jgi:hypothetical protein